MGAGHVFISYVRDDSRQVDQLQLALEAAGIPVWRDTTDLWPGEDWRAKIRRAITDNALVFIACFSQESLARDKSYQNEELTLAIEQMRLRPPDKPWLIPVRFDDCEIPDRDMGAGRTLTSIQRADLFGDRSDEGITRLTAVVLQILKQPADASASKANSAPKAQIAAHKPMGDARMPERYKTRMPERYKTLWAMLELGEFSVSEIATLSGVGESTVRTILRREASYVERVGRAPTGRQGGQPVRWRLRPDARKRLRAQLREFEHEER
jgi:hypothetical protein